VADIKRLRLSGLIAWVIWLVVHLWYVIGFRNRLLVLIQWSFSFVTRGRGARIISRPTTTERTERRSTRGAVKPSS
jgi:NADH dehydrogenase